MVTSYGPNAVSHAGVKFDKTKWAPRLGLAWSLPHNTVLRGAFGIFYSAEANIFDDLGLNPPQLSFIANNYNASATPSASQLISTGLSPDVPGTRFIIPTTLPSTQLPKERTLAVQTRGTRLSIAGSIKLHSGRPHWLRGSKLLISSAVHASETSADLIW